MKIMKTIKQIICAWCNPNVKGTQPGEISHTICQKHMDIVLCEAYEKQLAQAIVDCRANIDKALDTHPEYDFLLTNLESAIAYQEEMNIMTKNANRGTYARQTLESVTDLNTRAIHAYLGNHPYSDDKQQELL